jgi:hypothetical protein
VGSILVVECSQVGQEKYGAEKSGAGMGHASPRVHRHMRQIFKTFHLFSCLTRRIGIHNNISRVLIN